VAFFVSSNFSLKSTLSDISIATPACFGGAISLVNLPPFHPKAMFALSIKWVSCKQQIVGSSFFNPVCLLVSFDEVVEVINIQSKTFLRVTL
jgi:hypothetical protein